MEFYDLIISEIIEETDNAKSFVFRVPEPLAEKYEYKAGQYLTLEAEINGRSVRRAYSMSSYPGELGLKVTVKCVESGLFSNYLHDNYKPGDKIKVSTPEGRFTLAFSIDKKRTHYFICAGSGITPIISLIKDCLENEPMSKVNLLYGSRSKENVIFYNELEGLRQRYDGQLFISFAYSREKKGGLMNLFRKSNDFSGRIDAETVRQFMIKFPQETNEAHYFICGPGEITTSSKNYLEKRGVEEQNIHDEYFTAPEETGPKPVIPEGRCTVEVELQGELIRFSMDSREIILNKLEELGYDPPYSCMSGTCSTCMAKVLEGEVKMDSSLALNKLEVENGFILTCQSHPVSEKVKITFDQ